MSVRCQVSARPITAKDISYDGDRIDLPNDWYAIVKTDYDTDLGEPWKAHDGHGVISDWIRGAALNMGTRRRASGTLPATARAERRRSSSSSVCDIHNGGSSVYGTVATVAAVGLLANGQAVCETCARSEYHYAMIGADGTTFATFRMECAARMDGAR